MSNPVKKKIVFSIQAALDSPLCVASGKDGLTDADVMQDYDGNPFVPASSIAGAMRAYLQKEKNTPGMLGYSDGEDGRMSALFLSDLIFQEGWELLSRDGVELDEDKTAVDGSKYDMQIIEAGAKAHFYAELTIRQENEQEYVNQFAAVLYGIHDGKLRLGRKKTRGFGKIRIIQVRKIEFTSKNYLEYAKVYQEKDIWCEDDWKKKPEEGWSVWEEWKEQKKSPTEYLRIQVPLRLQGGISIRQYASKKGEPDFVQMVRHCKTDRKEQPEEMPIIPGSSIAGALKHRLKQILLQLENAGQKIGGQKLLDMMFGYVDGQDAHISMITVCEAVIEESTPLTVTRTGVSRFESAARKRSLFTEKMYVGGNLNLEILIQKGIDEEREWMLGLLLLAIRDLQNGYLAIGGETAIGRGIFEKNGEILMDGELLDTEQLMEEAFLNLEKKVGRA